MDELKNASSTDPEVKINIDNPVGDKPIVIEIVKREGAANVIREARKVLVIGNIYAVREFILKNYKNETELQNGIIIITGTDTPDELPTIQFDSAPAWDKDGSKITSVMEVSPDFADFKFNQGGNAFRTSEQMIQFLRSHSHCFSSKEDVRTLIKGLQNQSVRFEQIAETKDDRSGNVEKAVKEQLKITKGELPQTMALSMPFFKGTPKQGIVAEIEIERCGTVPVFAFYCLGIEEDVNNSAKGLVNEQIDEHIKSLFVTIYK
ncbi:hypothetical protein JZU46_02055 [bacterium]|jgi:hypothetical protein|nr:hypothetical protein [bacterium]